MAGQGNEDKIAELLKQAYQPAAATPEFKDKLRQRVNSEAGAQGASTTQTFWQQPFIWAPAAAAVLAALALVLYFVLVYPTPPAVSTNDATNIQTTAATLNGNLDSLGRADKVDVSFEWGTTTDYSNETAPESKTDTGSFSIVLSGLEPNITYHFRAKAVGDGTAYGEDKEFTAGIVPPSVITNEASNIGINSAQLNCDLTSLGTAGNVKTSFEWGVDVSYGNETTPKSKSGTGSWSASLTGLEPNTTYHFRAKAVGDGVAYGADGQFTTGTTPPSVTTNDAGNIGTNSAQLKGDLKSLGTADKVSVSFVWGTNPGGPYPNETASQVMTSTGAFYFDTDNLKPGVTYYHKAKAVGDGTSYGTERSFATLTVLPSVETNAAGNIGTDSARLNGNLTSLGTAEEVSVSFLWGTTAGGPYSDETTAQKMIGTGAFYFDLGNLSSGVTYYYKAKAVGKDTSYGAEKSFTTLTTPPSVTTGNATDVRSTSATLNGTLDNLGTAGSVIVSFEWGTTAGGPYTSLTDNQTMTGTGAFSANLTGLDSKTTYHFRVKAVGDEVAYGDDMTFVTGDTVPSQKTWYLSADRSGDQRIMYEGDTSKQESTLTMLSGDSVVWRADKASGGATYLAGRWAVQTTLGHFTSGHKIKIEIGTLNGSVFQPYGNCTFAGPGNGIYKADVSVSSFTVPDGGYVAIRITVTSKDDVVYVYVGGDRSSVSSPLFSEDSYSPEASYAVSTGKQEPRLQPAVLIGLEQSVMPLSVAWLWTQRKRSNRAASLSNDTIAD